MISDPQLLVLLSPLAIGLSVSWRQGWLGQWSKPEVEDDVPIVLKGLIENYDGLWKDIPTPNSTMVYSKIREVFFFEDGNPRLGTSANQLMMIPDELEMTMNQKLGYQKRNRKKNVGDSNHELGENLDCRD